jgi:hypothetical protein
MGAHRSIQRAIRDGAPITQFRAANEPKGFTHLQIPGGTYVPFRVHGKLPQQDRSTFDNMMDALNARMTVPLDWQPLPLTGIDGMEFIFRADPSSTDDAGVVFNNPFIPSGYTYLLQLVAHDTVFTRVPFWAADDLATETDNDRSERLRLQALYGGGPTVRPIIYAPDTLNDYSRTKLQLGKTGPLGEAGPLGTGPTYCPFRDIARLQPKGTLLDRNRLSEPLVADPRNDDHALIAQLTMLFHLLHNTFVALQSPVADDTSDPNFTKETNDCFQRAREATTLVYRYIIRHDLMRRILHPKVYKLYNEFPNRAILDPNVGWQNSKLPLEYSHAAFRFAHCMPRIRYLISDRAVIGQTTLIDALIASSSSNNSQLLPLGNNWIIAWSNFFCFPDRDNASSINLSQRIGPFVPMALAGNDRFNRISPNNSGAGVIFRDLISAGLAQVWSVNALIDSIRGASDDHRALIESIALLHDPECRRQAIRTWMTLPAAAPVWQQYDQPGGLGSANVIDTISAEPPLPFFVMFEAASDPTYPGCRLGILGSIIIAEVIFGELHRNRLPHESGTANLCSQLKAIHPSFADQALAAQPVMRDVIEFVTRHLPNTLPNMPDEMAISLI